MDTIVLKQLLNQHYIVNQCISQPASEKLLFVLDGNCGRGSQLATMQRLRDFRVFNTLGAFLLHPFSSRLRNLYGRGEEPEVKGNLRKHCFPDRTGQFYI